MARTPKTAEATGRFDHLDDEAHYDVTLTKPFKIGRTWLRPGTPAALKGKVIKEQAEFIDDATPVPA